MTRVHLILMHTHPFFALGALQAIPKTYNFTPETKN